MGKKLNTAQQKAVCHETGPMLVLAGPGSGKTTVLLCRISRLLERGLAKPQEILALTFSKAAAEEMKSRFENLNGASGVSFGTFHSIFFRILRSRYGWNVEQIFQVYDLGPGKENLDHVRIFLCDLQRKQNQVPVQ